MRLLQLSENSTRPERTKKKQSQRAGRGKNKSSSEKSCARRRMGAVFLLQATALNLQQVNSFRKGKARWRGRWGTLPGGFFLCMSRNGLRPHLERRQSRLTRIIREPCGGEWALVGNCSICRICGETLKPPPPFSSSERSTSKKKCNTVTTFGKRRK